MKPVAWMYYDERKTLRLCQTMPPDDNSFPVYTAPRELSDEKINEVVESCRHSLGSSFWTREFAKAILKKASEE